MLQPIPVPLPNILDASRPDLAGVAKQGDPDKQIAALREALEHACDYGRRLWQDVAALRGYLLRSLPSDPRAPGPHTAAASPRGPDDDKGWEDWVAAYSEASSVLAGPDGDSGFGLKEARQEADVRRASPNMRLLSAHPQLFGGPHSTGSPNRRPSGWPSVPMVFGIAASTLAARAVVVKRLRRKSP